MKKITLSNCLIFGFILVLGRCSPKNGFDILNNSQIKMKNCAINDLQIKLDSIIFRDARPVKVLTTHHNMSLEAVLTIRNTGTADVEFEIDHHNYSYFNFKGLIKNSILNDTVNFNSFHNPKSVIIAKRGSFSIVLGSYDFPFFRVKGDLDDNTLAELINSFDLVYETLNGKEVCISQDTDVVVGVRD